MIGLELIHRESEDLEANFASLHNVLYQKRVGIDTATGGESRTGIEQNPNRHRRDAQQTGNRSVAHGAAQVVSRRLRDGVLLLGGILLLGGMHRSELSSVTL